MPHERERNVSVSSIHDDEMVVVAASAALTNGVVDLNVLNQDDGGFDEVEQHGPLPLHGDVSALTAKRVKMEAESKDCADAGLVSRQARMEELHRMHNNNNIIKKPKQPVDPKVEWKTEVAKQRHNSGNNDHQPIVTEDVQTAERHVKQLLQACGQTQWRAPLRDLIQECLTQDHLSQLMDFIIPMFEESIKKKTSANSGSHPIRVPTSSSPTAFSYNSWKLFMRHLGYTITEPDSNREIHYCCLSLPSKVSLGTLEGVTSLLKAMHETPLADLKILSHMKAQEVQNLRSVVTTLQVAPNSIAPEKIQTLWNSHKTVAKRIGFRKDGHKDYEWVHTVANNRSVWMTNILLIGLHSNPEIAQYITLV